MWAFNNIFKQTIWGGDRLLKFKQASGSESCIGESWEISAVPGSESVVSSGPDKGLTLTQLLEKYGAALLGRRNYEKYGNKFPLLVKFIDAAADLSVQVHPSDELAAERGLGYGKTEMWYVVDAAKGARLANGFNAPVDPAEYQKLVESGEIEEKLRYCPIRKGEAFFIPAGRVHAIGAGAFVAEIQESSDVTYRLYDYHRKDAEGRERQLHTAEAFEAINFNDTEGAPINYTPKDDIPVSLVKSPFFSTNVLNVSEKLMRDYKESDTFVIIIAISGAAKLTCGGESLMLREGHSVLVPASAKGLEIVPEQHFSALETFIK